MKYSDYWILFSFFVHYTLLYKFSFIFFIVSQKYFDDTTHSDKFKIVFIIENSSYFIQFLFQNKSFVSFKTQVPGIYTHFRCENVRSSVWFSYLTLITICFLLFNTSHCCLVFQEPFQFLSTISTLFLTIKKHDISFGFIPFVLFIVFI